MNNLKNDYINIQNETEKYYKNIEPQMFEIKKKAFLNLYNQLKKMRENFNFIEYPIEITFNITDKNDIEYEYHIKFNKNSIFIENIYIPGNILPTCIHEKTDTDSVAITDTKLFKNPAQGYGYRRGIHPGAGYGNIPYRYGSAD